MKKIFVTILALAALFVSCSSPYYPEYVPVVSLGAHTDNLVCESDENQCSLNVISNVEYEATIVSGMEWLSFADTKSLSRKGSGNGVLVFKHLANNNDKRVAILTLQSGSRLQTVKIKQKGYFEDFLRLDVTDEVYKKLFTLNDNTRMLADNLARDYALRLDTSCQDHEISFATDYPKAIVDFKVENGYFYFHINDNDENQPRIMEVTLSYVDGWKDVKTFTFTIKQE